MNFLSGEADVESVGGVSSAGQLHTQLRRRHTGELPRCLAEVRVLRRPDFSYSTNIKGECQCPSKVAKSAKTTHMRQVSVRVFKVR